MTFCAVPDLFARIRRRFARYQNYLRDSMAFCALPKLFARFDGFLRDTRFIARFQGFLKIQARFNSLLVKYVWIFPRNEGRHISSAVKFDYFFTVFQKKKADTFQIY